MQYNNENYDINAIETLSFKDGVRKRIGMYLGSADMQGVYQAIQEIISNSIDEYYMGYGNVINIKIDEKNNLVTVEDEGRGIPFGIKEDGSNVLIDIFSKPHTGGKFNDKTYKAVAGLNGIGAKATCLSSLSFSVKSYRKNKVAYASWKKGNFIEYSESGNSTKEYFGTSISFIPDPEVFKDEPIKISFKYICEICKNLSYLTKNLTFKLTNGEENIEYCAKNGLLDLLKEKINNPISKPIYIFKKIEDCEIEIAFQWTKDKSLEYCFTNGLINIEGGSPVTGFKTSLTRNLNKILNTEFTGEIIRTGLNFAISCKVPNPSFANQTKTKINNPELRGYADQACSEILKTLTNKELENIKQFLEQEEKAFNAAKKARETVRKSPLKKNKLKTTLPGKLADCSSKDPLECELYLIEGDSAAGTVKGARDPQYQAVLPLRGKVINTQKADFNKIIANKEIQDMITAIGTDILQNFNINNLKYDKIIMCSDADVDGSHIRILLLTFFLNFMPELIKQGKVYAAMPPLYTIGYKNNIYYALDDEELNNFLLQHPNGEKNIQYLKGLGEMSAASFSDTVMNKEKRNLKQITMEDANLAMEMFNKLMGKDVQFRKEFLEKNATYATLDV